MATHIQIRNVPEDVHRELKLRAVRAGMSLSELLLREVTELARRPSVDELLERIRSRPPVRVSESSVTAVRAEREGRG